MKTKILKSMYRWYTSTAFGRFIAEQKMMHKHDLEVKHYKDYFKHHGKYISQDGSDKWIIEEVFKHKKGGYFFECGAYTGAKKSNTFILEQFYEWSGICVEANPNYFKKLQRARNCICLNNCIDGKEGDVDFLCYKTTGGIVDHDTVNDIKTTNKKLSEAVPNSKIIKIKTKTLWQILEENNAPKVIDFLVLDAKGAENRIMESFPFDKYRFLTMDICWVNSKLDNYFIRNGYQSVKEFDTGAGNNTFYVHESLEFSASN